MVYNMLVASIIYLPFISFLGIVHAKIRIILYKKELLHRKIGISDFVQQFFPKWKKLRKMTIAKNATVI